MRELLRLVCMAMLSSAGLVQAAAAEQFIWSQNGGFVLPGADPSLTLRAGQFFGADAAPIAAHGGLELFDLQAAPAPANTFRVISWGCVNDGDNTAGVTDCANGGTAANAQVLVDPTPAPGVGTPRTLDQHVVILYRTFLGRDPAPAEVAPWVDYLQSFRMAVADAFIGSPEL